MWRTVLPAASARRPSAGRAHRRAPARSAATMGAVASGDCLARVRRQRCSAHAEQHSIFVPKYPAGGVGIPLTCGGCGWCGGTCSGIAGQCSQGGCARRTGRAVRRASTTAGKMRKRDGCGGSCGVCPWPQTVYGTCCTPRSVPDAIADKPWLRQELQRMSGRSAYNTSASPS